MPNIQRRLGVGIENMGYITVYCFIWFNCVCMWPRLKLINFNRDLPNTTWSLKARVHLTCHRQKKSYGLFEKIINNVVLFGNGRKKHSQGAKQRRGLLSRVPHHNFDRKNAGFEQVDMFQEFVFSKSDV